MQATHTGGWKRCNLEMPEAVKIMEEAIASMSWIAKCSIYNVRLAPVLYLKGRCSLSKLERAPSRGSGAACIA